jgi:lysozyme
MTKIIEMLRAHEGVETHAYKCTADKITIGVGRNIDPAGGIGLEDHEIDYLLTNDVARVVTELNNSFDWFFYLNQARKDAMVDMCFNLGLPRLKQFKNALAAMENEDYELAAEEFFNSRWAKQVGNRAHTVTEIISSGEY